MTDETENVLMELNRIIKRGEPYYRGVAELAIELIERIGQENAKLKWLEAQFESLERGKMPIMITITGDVYSGEEFRDAFTKALKDSIPIDVPRGTFVERLKRFLLDCIKKARSTNR